MQNPVGFIVLKIKEILAKNGKKRQNETHNTFIPVETLLIILFAWNILYFLIYFFQYN